jgi:dihydroxyacetone kinase-like protein
MAGFSISLLKWDDELKGYLDAPAQTPFFVIHVIGGFELWTEYI